MLTKNYLHTATTTPKPRKVRRTPILVVENNPDQWLVIRAALAQAFPEVEPIWKNHPLQVLSYLDDCTADSRSVPRLILMEPYLPTRKDGWALLEKIKAHPRHQLIPVVIMSHSGTVEDISEAYALSVASYITKPTTYGKWVACFQTLRRYWWEVVSFPTSV
ncbi:response regulator [Spirosoma lituiforme]|nr:MAG: response regulator [Cytophagaceae bacterium]